MNKKKIMVIIFALLFFVTIFFTIKKAALSNNLSKLEKYLFTDGEVIQKEYNLSGEKYVLTSYYKANDTYAYNNILMKNENDYYLLETIERCDISEYLKGNDLYVHCIGKPGVIMKYSISNTEVEKSTINLLYDNILDISQIHIIIEKVDDDYIYLKSLQNHIKCSFNTKICEYDI